jgi:hypothetical protein
LGNKGGFGLYQGMGTVAGVIIAGVGAWWANHKVELPAAPAVGETPPPQKAPPAKIAVSKKGPRQAPPRKKTPAVKKTARKKRPRK